MIFFAGFLTTHNVLFTYVFGLYFLTDIFFLLRLPGTDTGGSVRVPAAFCGILGFRPSHGAISVSGVLPMAQSFDTVGNKFYFIHVVISASI